MKLLKMQKKIARRRKINRNKIREGALIPSFWTGNFDTAENYLIYFYTTVGFCFKL